MWKGFLPIKEAAGSIPYGVRLSDKWDQTARDKRVKLLWNHVLIQSVSIVLFSSAVLSVFFS